MNDLIGGTADTGPGSIGPDIPPMPEPDLPRARNGLIKGTFIMMSTPWNVPTGATPLPAANLNTLVFDGKGHFTGRVKVRFGNGFSESGVEGYYMLWKNAALGTIEGNLIAHITDFAGYNQFHIIRRTSDEIDMLLRAGYGLTDTGAVPGSVVVNATLRRVPRNWLDWLF